jgi:hypothetical protein
MEQVFANKLALPIRTGPRQSLKRCAIPIRELLGAVIP